MELGQRSRKTDVLMLTVSFILGVATSWGVYIQAFACTCIPPKTADSPSAHTVHETGSSTHMSAVRNWLKAQFDLMDQDRDGLLDSHDVKKANQTMNLKGGYANKMSVLVGSQEMSFESLRQVRGWLHTQFQLLDIDQDGTLDMHDLSQMMRLSRKIDLQPGYAKRVKNNVGHREMTFEDFMTKLKRVEAVTGNRAKEESLQPADTHGTIEESISRATLLLGLMFLQSGSAIVLSRYEALLKEHLIVMLFLTMLVGAGGNVGNQSVIKVIEQLLEGKLKLTGAACAEALLQQLTVGILLAIILGIGGFLRAFMTQYRGQASSDEQTRALKGCIAVTVALMAIVLTSAVLGTILPLALAFVGLDVAHAGPSIQVVMDIGGVIITCSTARLILEPNRKYPNIGQRVTAT